MFSLLFISRSSSAGVKFQNSYSEMPYSYAVFSQEKNNS
nr:MAG TPA: hypothetical protein [Caudoviricetes sp.]